MQKRRSSYRRIKENVNGQGNIFLVICKTQFFFKFEYLLCGKMFFSIYWKLYNFLNYCYGGRSSAGRALDCDSSGRGFKPLRSPQFFWWLIFNIFCQYSLHAGVVQLDRASDFESECWEFESLRPHQKKKCDNEM